MVFNDSRVFPARMYGVRVDTGAKIELLAAPSADHQASGTHWRDRDDE